MTRSSKGHMTEVLLMETGSLNPLGTQWNSPWDGALTPALDRMTGGSGGPSGGMMDTNGWSAPHLAPHHIPHCPTWRR
jgi:hypothetical protein